jgi:HlyD family secretion protein
VASARFMSKATWAITAAAELLPNYIEERLSLKHLETDVLNHRVDGARAEQEMAVRRLKRATIKSPVDGIVLRRLVKNEEYLAAGTLLMEIGDMRELEVTADILSQDVVTVRPGNAVDIYGPSIGDSSIRGTVSHIKPAGFTKVSSLGVDQQRVPVNIAFDPDALKHLKEGGRTLGLAYRVRVRIYTEEKKDVLKVPRTALFRGAGHQWQVFSIKNGKAALMSVTLGIMNDDEAEIKGGLSKGDAVIVAPPKALRDGDRVKPS